MIKQLILIFGVTFAVNGVILVDQVKIALADTSLANGSITFINDGVHDSIMNLSVQFFRTILNIKTEAKIYAPEDKNDKTYRRIFFQTTVDAARLLRGIEGNFVIKVFMENFLKCLDFKPKFPLKPGIYRAVNFYLTDKYVPHSIESKGYVALKIYGKLAMNKPYVHLGNFDYYGEIRKTKISY